jgi:hypothetical protein
LGWATLYHWEKTPFALFPLSGIGLPLKHNRALQGVILARLVAILTLSLALSAGWDPLKRCQIIKTRRI